MERKSLNKSDDIKFGLTKRQRSWVYTGTFIAVVILFFVINNINGEPEEGPYPPDYVPASQKELKVAPDFALKSTGDKAVKLSDYKGKIIILDFWATWCPPCRKGIPDLIAIKKEYEKKGVEIIGISVDDEKTIEQVKSFALNQKMNYPVVYADKKVVSDYGDISNIPTTIIIDKKGNIVTKYVGLYPKETYTDEINRLLKQ